MKRLIPTLLLVILCIGGFWYASSKNFFKEKTDTGTALVKVNKDDVASFTIKTADSDIEMQHKDGKWTMTKPSALPLNTYSADGWVDSFNALTKDKTVDANATDLAQFGLDKPTQQFTVTMQDKTVHTLSVGSPVAIQGFSYGMFSGSPEVFRISDEQVKPLAIAQLDFMEKSPVTMVYDQVSSMMIDWKGHKWTLSKSDPSKKATESDWKLGDQTIKGADVSPYLDKLLYLSTDVLVKASSTVKMDAPELRIEVKSTDASKKETTVVYLGKIDQDNVWFMKENDPWAYSIPVATIQELSDLDKPKETPAAPSATPNGTPAAPGATPAPSGGAPAAPGSAPAPTGGASAPPSTTPAPDSSAGTPAPAQ